jgi:tRNA threonylcarbamoyladenosine biosynthesis protein TsaB
MTTLCIETSTSCCSAAICKDGLALANRENLLAANHASELPLFIEQLLAEARANQWSIDAVALSQGPGSYTGLRIGTSIAKGICYGMNIPLIPIDTLRILSAAVQDFPMIERNSWLCPMIDARRMEVYTAFYHANTLERLNEIESKIIDNTAFEEHLGNHEIYLFGNGAAKCKEVILSPHAHFIDDIVPRAIYMGMLLENAPSLDAKQMAYYEPFYLKEFVPAPSHIKGLK